MDPVNDGLPERLAAAMRELETRALQRSARVSAERVAARVEDRLRREGAVRSPRVWWLRPATLRVAAAVVLVVAAGWTVRLTHVAGPQAAVRLPVVMPAIDSLTTGQLESVLEAAGEVRAANFGPVLPSNGSLDSLSEQQLQMVLASL